MMVDPFPDRFLQCYRRVFPYDIQFQSIDEELHDHAALAEKEKTDDFLE